MTLQARFAVWVLCASVLVCAPRDLAAMTCGTHAETSTTNVVSVNRDPFASRGKLLLESMSQDSQLSHQMAAGTEFAMTVANHCTNQGEITRELPGRSVFEVEVTSRAWRLPRAMSLEELEHLANTDACLLGLSERPRYETMALPSDPEIVKQMHLRAIEAGAASDIISSAVSLRPVVIAIIDTGVDINHPDLKNVLWTNAGEIPDNGIDDDGNGFVDDVNGFNFADQIPSPAPIGTWNHQHGTHVAGLAAAQGGNGIGVTGVIGEGARLMALNVFGKGSGAYVTDIANAIRYAADNGADVINLSLGGSNRNATYESALNYAIQKGVTIVAAAGNDASEIGPRHFQTPASYSPFYEGLIAVSATDAADGKLSSFSNYNGNEVELSAPGAEGSGEYRGLLSTWPGGTYARLQGTSMAAPLVTGAAGLAIRMLRSLGYSPSPETIERVLIASAVQNPSLFGQVKAGHALNLRSLAEYLRDTFPQRQVDDLKDLKVPISSRCQ